MKIYERGTKIEGRTLFFTASWCPPCQQVKRALGKPGAEAVAAQLLVVDVDTPAGEKLATKHGVQSIPTFVRPDGATETGAMTVRQLAKWIAADD